MNRWFELIVTALAATSMVGCVGTLGDSEVGRMSGALGEVEFSGAPEIREATLDAHELRLDLRVHNEAGSAMVGITIPHEGLSGDEVVFHPERAEMIGCSGEVDDSWDFDCEPQDFFVDLYGGKESIGVDFEATWTDDDCHDLPEDAPEDGQPVDGYVDVDLI